MGNNTVINFTEAKSQVEAKRELDNNIKIYKDDSKEPLDIDFTENNKSSDDCREFTTDYFSKENTNEDLNGLYKVIVVATDKAGNIYNESEEIVAEFTIDNTRPIVSFDGVEEGHYFGIITDNEDLQKKNNITVVVKDDNISEINSIEIKNGTEGLLIVTVVKQDYL